MCCAVCVKEQLYYDNEMVELFFSYRFVSIFVLDRDCTMSYIFLCANKVKCTKET